MAYDPADGYVLLWLLNLTSGGTDTWTYSGGQWKMLAPATSPPVNTNYPTMTFDPDPAACWVGTNGCLVLMMGRTYGTELEWQYAGGSWVNATGSLTHIIVSPQSDLGLAFDQNRTDCGPYAGANGCLMAASGWDVNATCGIPCIAPDYSVRVWAYNEATKAWGSFPSGVSGGAVEDFGATTLLYDPNVGHLLMRAPMAQLCHYEICGLEPSTLELTSSGWSFLYGTCGSTPYCSDGLHGLENAGIVFDAANAFAFVFGGMNSSSSSAFNTSWAFYGDQFSPPGSAWLNLDELASLGTGPNPSPHSRFDPFVAYDPNSADCGGGTPAHGCVVLFGGSLYQDTWRFWLPVTPEIYANPDPVSQGHTLWINVTVVGGTGHFIWFNRTWKGSTYPVGCAVNSIADDLHSRVSCVPTFSTSCPGAHGNFFNVSVTVTDSSGEQGTSGWDPLVVNPSPLVVHFYDRYPVWWQGVDLGLLDPVGINDLTDNFGIATWAQSYDPNSPTAWVAIDAEAVLVQEQTPLPLTWTSWDGVGVDYATLTASQLAKLPLDDSIEFSVQLGPAGSSTACATVYSDLNLNATYGKHKLSYFPVGLSGQYGAVDPGSMVQPLLEGIPAMVAATTASITTLSWGDQGGHGQILAFNATYFINATLVMNIAALTGATLPDPVAGTASIIPRANVALSISSFGKVSITAGASVQFPLGKVAGISFTITESFTAQAKFQFEQYYAGLTYVGHLVLTNFSIALGVVIKASVTFPIYGISLGPLGTIGFTMTIAVALGATIGVFFNQTNAPLTCPVGCFLGWLPVVLQKVQALISLAISVALGLSIAVASISMGGTLEFDIYLQNVQPVLRGWQLIGTVFVSVSVLFWTWTDNLWSGVIASNGTPNPGILGGPGYRAANNSFVVGPRYYNVSGYQAVVWVPGSVQGPLINDVYPSGAFDMAGGSGGPAVLYATDNVSQPRNLGLSLGMLSLDPANRTATPVSFSLPPGEIEFNPRLVSVNGGGLLALWDALPDAQTTVAGPSQVTGVSLQSALWDPTSRTWGPPTTLSTGAFPISYTAGSCGTDTRVVHLDAPSLLGHGGSLVEQDLVSGVTIASVSDPLASDVVSFDCPSGLVSVRNIDGNYTVVNMTSGTPWAVPTVPGYNLSFVSHAGGSPGDLAVLYRDSSSTQLQIDGTGGQLLANVTLPENVSSVQVDLDGGTWVVAAQAPDGVQVYLVQGTSLALVRDLPWQNLTQTRLSVSPGGTATLVGETKNGGPGLPWMNLSAAYVPLTAVGPISALPGSVDAGAPVTLSATAESVNGPLQYLWTGLPPGCVSLNAPSITCTPTTPGTYGIALRVTDGRGVTATSSTLTFEVGAPPAVGAVNVSSARVEAGSFVNFTAPVSSLGATSFAYSWFGLPPGCTSVSTPLLVCAPSAPGNYTVGVTELDLRGGSVSETPVSIEVLPRLAVAFLTASGDQVATGTSVRFSASGEAGVGPYAYSWGGLPSGCASVSVSSLSCSFPAAGTFWVTVVITDADGITAARSVKIVVESPPAAGVSAFLLEVLLLVGVAAVAAANVAVWWWLPKRKARGAGPKAEQDTSETPAPTPGSATPAQAPATISAPIPNPAPAPTPAPTPAPVASPSEVDAGGQAASPPASAASPPEGDRGA